MKNNNNIIKIAIIILSAVFAISGCEKPIVEVPIVPEPAVLEVEVNEALITMTSAAYSISYTDATQILYTYYLPNTPENEKSWQSKEVSPSLDTLAFDVELSDLTFETTYLVEAYAMNEDIAQTAPVVAEFTTAADSTPKLSFKDAELNGYNTAKVIATVSNAEVIEYTYYKKNQRPEEVVWYELTVSENGEYEIDITGLAASSTETTQYTIEGQAANKSTALKSDVVTGVFQTIKTDMVRFSNELISPTYFAIDADILDEFCNSFVWSLVKAEDFVDTEEFLDDFYEDKMGDDIVSSDSTIVATGLKVSTAYKLIFMPLQATVVSEEQTDYKALGDPVVLDYSTTAYDLGTSKSDFSMEVLQGYGKDITLTTIPAVFYPKGNDIIEKVYYGYIPSSNVKNDDVQAYITSTGNEWFYGSRLSNFYKNQYNSETKQYDKVYLDSLAYSFTKVTPNTEFYVVAVPADEKGFLGNASYAKFTTLQDTPQADMQATISVEPDYTSAKFTGTQVGDKTQTILVYNVINDPEHKDYKTADQAYAELIIGATGGYFSSKISVSSGTGTYNKTYLQLNTDYIAYYLPIDGNGNYGVMDKLEYTTKDVIYDAVDCTLELKSVVGEPGQYGRIDYTVTVGMGGNTTQYMYGTLGTSSIDPEKTDEENAKALVVSSSKKITTDEAFSFYVYNANYYIVLIPMDKDGKLGSPILRNLSSTE